MAHYSSIAEDIDSEEEESDFLSAVVFDHGFCLKAGFAGDDAPRTVLPTLVGKPKHSNSSKKSLFLVQVSSSKQNIVQNILSKRL